MKYRLVLTDHEGTVLDMIHVTTDRKLVDIDGFIEEWEENGSDEDTEE